MKNKNEETYLDSLKRMELELQNYKSFRHDFCKCLLALSDKYSMSDSTFNVSLTFTSPLKNYFDFTVCLSGEMAVVKELEPKSVIRIARKEKEEEN